MSIPKFDITEVVKSFRLLELEKPLCAFIDQISYSKKDQSILQTWMVYLTKKGVPWAVTETLPNNCRPSIRLWKMDERLSDAEVKLERANPAVSWFADKEVG